MRKSDQMYEVEIKSQALVREGKKGLITYFQGGNKLTIVQNCMALYPQFCKPEDKPQIEITPITLEEYEKRANGGIISQKKHLVNARGVA